MPVCGYFGYTRRTQRVIFSTITDALTICGYAGMRVFKVYPADLASHIFYYNRGPNYLRICEYAGIEGIPGGSDGSYFPL